SSRRRHTRFSRDWSSDVCSSDLGVSIDGDESLTVLDDLVVTRRLLEADMANVAARVADREVLDRLGELVDRMDRLVDDTESYHRSEERRVGKACRTRSARDAAQE